LPRPISLARPAQISTQAHAGCEAQSSLAWTNILSVPWPTEPFRSVNTMAAGGGSFACSRSRYTAYPPSPTWWTRTPRAPRVMHWKIAKARPPGSSASETATRQIGNRNRRPNHQWQRAGGSAASNNSGGRAIPSSCRDRARARLPPHPHQTCQQTANLPPVAGLGSPPRLQMELRTCAARSSASPSSGRGAVPSPRLFSRHVSYFA